jgi:hypothetical protein
MEKDDFPAARWLVPLGLILGAALLLLFPLAKPIWTDESISIGRGRLPLAEILGGRMGAADAMPLHSLMLSLIGKPLGDTLATHRLVSAFPAAIALWYIYLIGRRLGTRTGTLSLWLAALSPCAVLFLRMSRYHGVTTLLVTMSCYYLLQLFDKSDKKTLVKYFFASALMMLSYPLTMFVIAGQFLIYALRFKQTQKPLLILGMMVLAGIAFLCYFIPALKWAQATFTTVNVEDPSMGLGLSGLIRRLALSVYALCLGETILPWNVALFVPGILLALGGFGAGLWALRRRPELLLPSLCIFVVIISGAATSTQLGGSTQTVGSMGKRTSFLIPLFCASLSMGFMQLRWRWLCLPLLAIWAVGVANYFIGREFLNPNYTVNWREAVATIQKVQSGPGTIVFSSGDPPVKYYIDEAKVPVPVNEERTFGGMEKQTGLKAAVAGGTRYIWLVGRDRGDRLAVADFEAARALLLKSGATRIHESGVYPRTEAEKKWLGRALKREVWPYYVVLELYRLP